MNIFYIDQSVGSTDTSCCPAYDQTNADDEDSGGNWDSQSGKASFPTFCQIDLPYSGKYIAANPCCNNLVELNDFFVSDNSTKACGTVDGRACVFPFRYLGTTCVSRLILLWSSRYICVKS